jgi:benzoyl-CoA-dihydrodiol lyase
VTAELSFTTEPASYRHWRLEIDGAVATLTLCVDADGGIVPGYELKKNSYDLGVYIELNDAVQRLRFSYPSVRAVIMTSGLDRMFCAGANIGMLAQSEHSFKVNFCKYCNETLAAVEDATSESGQTYIAALNGTAAGGGYELALACAQILLTDDGSSTVALPEVPLLGVLPGTGGLTRLTDKRGVRRDLADVFSTTAEGIRGQRAIEWQLVDEIARPTEFDAAVRRMAQAAIDRVTAASSAGAAELTGAELTGAELTGAGEASHPGTPHPAGQAGVELTSLTCFQTEGSLRYEHVLAEFDRAAGTVTLTISGPDAVPSSVAELHEAGAAGWSLACARGLDDAISRLRFGEAELGTWLIKTSGDPAAVLATDEVLGADDWLAREITGLWKRTLRRLDATSRSLIALVEPGSCFAGTLLELALAADRQYMLDGIFEDGAGDDGAIRDGALNDGAGGQRPAVLIAGAMNDGPLAAANGATRLAIRFGPAGDDQLAAVLAAAGKELLAAQAVELGLVTAAPDDLDWDDEIRLVVSERAGFSPDALTGLEASLRFAGQESTGTKIFGRLAAWQNWIFLRPNASGPQGALRRYGTGQRAEFDRKRV